MVILWKQQKNTVSFPLLLLITSLKWHFGNIWFTIWKQIHQTNISLRFIANYYYGISGNWFVFISKIAISCTCFVFNIDLVEIWMSITGWTNHPTEIWQSSLLLIGVVVEWCIQERRFYRRFFQKIFKGTNLLSECYQRRNTLCDFGDLLLYQVTAGHSLNPFHSPHQLPLTPINSHLLPLTPINSHPLYPFVLSHFKLSNQLDVLIKYVFLLHQADRTTNT